MKNSSSIKRKPSSSRQPSLTPDKPDKKLKMNGEIQEISLKKKSRKPNNEVASLRRILRGDSVIEEEQKTNTEKPNEINNEKEGDLLTKSNKEKRNKTNKKEITSKNIQNKDENEIESKSDVSQLESNLTLNEASHKNKNAENSNSQELNGNKIKRGEDPVYKRILRRERNANEKSVENEKIEISISPVERQNVEVKKTIRKKQQKINENLEKYNIAIQKLQENSLSDCIPCRENEKKQIHDFLNVLPKNSFFSIINFLYRSL